MELAGRPGLRPTPVGIQEGARTPNDPRRRFPKSIHLDPQVQPEDDVFRALGDFLLRCSVLIVAALALSGCKEEAKSSDPCPKLAAYAAVQDSVKDELVSPASAQFPANPEGPLFSNGEVIIATKGDCVFGVSAHVDSENRMSALLRTNFSATAAFNRHSKTWNVTGLSMAPR